MMNAEKSLITWLPGSSSHRTAMGCNVSQISAISCISEGFNQLVPRSRRASFTVKRKIFFGRSLGRFPSSEIHLSAFLAGLVLSNLTVWPISCTPLSAISLLNGIVPTRRRTSLFVTLSYHLILTTFLRQRCWKTSSSWILLVVLSHVLIA